MAASEPLDWTLHRAARRAYERGRLRSALWLGTAFSALALPGFLMCKATALALVCLAGFGLVVAAGRLRGEGYEEGARAGAFAGILPCLLPAALRVADPVLCDTLFAGGPWLCAAAGAASGAVLGLRGRRSSGSPFWTSAIVAFGFAAALGCIPAGVMGFAGLVLGVAAGAAPLLVAQKSSP